ncbi:hypothetical protein Salat_1019300 [Sesamum alatum]|uniref:Uncharacterized protein n=1 Tax=Sesamum alatum TaxID=300844 RepID=A0AAE1YML1_9LAMI|nr:hypothetical protein Salat_1019300 [Sesamum alatum]
MRGWGLWLEGGEWVGGWKAMGGRIVGGGVLGLGADRANDGLTQGVGVAGAGLRPWLGWGGAVSVVGAGRSSGLGLRPQVGWKGGLQSRGLGIAVGGGWGRGRRLYINKY